MIAPPRAARFLESALLITFITHGLAMVTMAVFLLPGMPGGGSSTDLLRVSYVANHPWIWRAGWLGWQLTAVSDLLLAIALLCTPWISKPLAMGTLAFTIIAIVPDQTGQMLWTWMGPQLAHSAVSSHHLATYLAFETRTFRRIAGYGGTAYLIAALGWTWCFANAGTWSGRLTALSIATWSLFGAATIVIFLPSLIRQHPALQSAVSIANALAFVLLMLWFASVTERVLQRARPTTIYGSHAFWRHPNQRLPGRFFDLIANARFTRAVGEYLPVFAMASDITDVIYINYLVNAERLQPLVPPKLLLQCIGSDRTYALFSILTYRHGHFGPACLGPLRQLWPSPIQSNWRIYVVDPQTGKRGVHFVTTAITSTPHALATRLLSEGVPMHVPQQAAIRGDAAKSIEAFIVPGNSSAPDLHGTFEPLIDPDLPLSWMGCFSSWNDVFEYCVPQDRAITTQPWYDRVATQEIKLDIPLKSCRPHRAQLDSSAARAIVGDATPVCFYVPVAAFCFQGETFTSCQTPRAIA